MKLLDRYRLWRAVRAELRHRAWLRDSRVIYLPKKPHHSTKRNGPEACP